MSVIQMLAESSFDLSVPSLILFAGYL